MGVKSTVTLSRGDAVRRIVSILCDRYRGELERVYDHMSNEQIEDILERANDERSGGEGFENYQIADPR